MTPRKDRSREDMAYAVRLANRGFDATQIFRALTEKRKGRRASVRYEVLLDERGKRGADRYARLTAKKAVEFVRKNPPTKGRLGPLAHLIHVRRAADRVSWNGLEGPRKALEATIQVGLRIPASTFSIALRRWAEEAGQDFRAIRRHRDKLIGLGWARRAPGKSALGSLTYRLDAPHSNSSPMSNTVPSAENLLCLYECAAYPETPDPTHDAWRPNGLGDRGWLVALSDAPGWRGMSDALDGAAAKLGVAGSLGGDRLRHEDERAGFRSRLRGEAS